MSFRREQIPLIHSQHAQVEVDPLRPHHGRLKLQQTPESQLRRRSEPRSARLLDDGRRVQQRLLVVRLELESLVQVGESLSLPPLLQVHDTQLGRGQVRSGTRYPAGESSGQVRYTIPI